jgi:hypothetical protein
MEPMFALEVLVVMITTAQKVILIVLLTIANNVLQKPLLMIVQRINCVY